MLPILTRTVQHWFAYAERRAATDACRLHVTLFTRHAPETFGLPTAAATLES